jgi:negative regulator of flagellin synthesis FlgM
MQINGLTSLHGAQALSGPHSNSRTNSASAPTSTYSTQDELQISDAGARLSETSDIRSARLASIKAAIADGSYDSSEKLSIALDRMLNEIG